MNTKVLRLNKAGTPIAWLSWQDAATLIVKEQVIWSLGEVVRVIHGGYRKCGTRSLLELPSIPVNDA